MLGIRRIFKSKNISKEIFDIEKSTTNFLKGVAILLVLLGHMGYVYRGGAWGVSLFLILSGYGIFKSYLDKGIKNFWGKKIIKVWVPYFLVTILVLLYNYIKFRIGWETITFSLLGIDFGAICDKTMWFVSFIFVQYALFYISAFLFKKIVRTNLKHSLMIVLCFVLSVLVLVLSTKYQIWGTGSGIFLYTFSFCFGLVIAKLGDFKINILAKKVLFSLISFVFFAAILYLYNNVNSNFEYFVYANLMPLSLIMVSEFIKFKNKLINYLGKISYDIYLWEGFFLVLKNDLFGDVKNQLLIDFCVIILCILFSQIYRKLFIGPVISLFVGKRK